MINKVLKLILNVLFLPFWQLEKVFPRNEKTWIFGSRYGSEFSDNAKYLYEYVTHFHEEITAVWITSSNDVFKSLSEQKYKVFLSKSFKGIWYCLRAKYCFLVTSKSDVNARFINGAKIIYLWHGMPLKKIGYDRDFHNERQTLLQRILYPYNNLFSCYAMLTSSTFFTPFLCSAWKLSEKKIWPTGYPRCDIFYHEKHVCCSYILNLRAQYHKCKIVLYMPTFRMAVANSSTPFNPFVNEYGFDEKRFFEVLEKQNIVFIYKPHVVDKKSALNLKNNRFVYLHYEDVEDTYELLNSVDALVTDYSSVYFDFLCTRKPIFLLTPDYKEYTENSRSHYFDMFEEMYAPVCKNWQEFCAELSNNSWKIPDETEVKKFAEFSDGQSCKKIVKEIVHD